MEARGIATFRERSPLLKFIQWPASTPTGRRFRDWLDELQQTPSEPSEGHMERIKAEGSDLKLTEEAERQHQDGD